MIPQAPQQRVLDRIAAVWSPDVAPHVLLYSATGGGKSTVIKSLMTLAGPGRVALLEPKRNPDPVYAGPPGEPWKWGRPVTAIGPRFGYQGEPGGGPRGLWFRITGSPDRRDTRARFGQALEVVANEGNAVLVIDDAWEVTRALGLNTEVESIMNVARSGRVCAVLSSPTMSYVGGRGNAAVVMVGCTGGSLPAARAAAGLLGWRGREAEDYCKNVARHSFIYRDNEDGSAGPCLMTGSPCRANSITRR